MSQEIERLNSHIDSQQKSLGTYPLLPLEESHKARESTEFKYLQLEQQCMQMTRDLDELKFKDEELENEKERNREMQATLLEQEGQLNQLKD